MIFLHLRARQWLSSYMSFQGLQVMQSEIAHLRFLGMASLLLMSQLFQKESYVFCNYKQFKLRKSLRIQIK